MKKIMTFLLAFLGIVSLIFALQELPNGSNNKQSSQEIAKYQKSKEKVEQDTKENSKKEANDILVKQVGNAEINSFISSLQGTLQKGFNLAYNSSENKSSQDYLKKNLPQIVGKSLSDKLISLNKPITTQDGVLPVSFGKMDSYKMSYGAYDYKNNSLPVYVVVNYESLPIDNSISGFSELDTTTTVTTKGTDIYELSYNIQTKQIKVVSYKGVTSNDNK